MSNLVPLPDAPVRPPPRRGRRRALRDAAVRAARAAGTALLAVYVIFCALFLTLRYAVLPNIDHYRGDIEQIASRALGNRVTIGGIHASWRGLRPELSLTDVAVRTPNGRRALALPEVSAVVSWWSVPAAGLRLERLEILRPDLRIERDADGRLTVAGIPIEPGGEEGGGADWVLSQHEIVIRDGRLRWRDAQRGAPELALSDVTLRLVNRWNRHRLGLRATPPEGYASPLDLRADFRHPALARHPGDVGQWKGELYVDVARADLAVWNAFVDYPVALSAGSGALRAWADVDRGTLTKLSADVALADVALRLRGDLPRLDLAQVAGRIDADQPGGGGFAALGERGQTVSLTGFSLRTRDGLALGPTAIRERAVAATRAAPASTEFSATRLDLRTLAALANRLPLPPSVRQTLAATAPQGSLEDVALRWQGDADRPVAYQVRGRFANLAVQAQPAKAQPGRKPEAAVPGLPGVARLSGSVDATERGGRLAIDSPGAALTFPGIFREPLPAFDHLRLRTSWQFPDDGTLALKLDELAFDRPGASGSASGTLRLPLHQPAGGSIGTADLQAQLAEFDLAQLGRYLPLRTPESLRQWLAGALRRGTARDVTMTLQGDLDRFPFRSHGNGGANGDGDGNGNGNVAGGVFQVAGRIERGALDVAPRAADAADAADAERWPLIDGIDGRFAFDRTRFRLDVAHASTHGAALTGVKAGIPDLLDDNRVLTIDGKAAGPLQNLVGFVNDSPVSGWIGRFLDETRATGDAQLALALKLPLAKLEATRVEGTLQLPGNDVTLMTLLPPLNGASGKLTFTEKGFQLASMRGRFLGGPFSLAGGSQPEGDILVTAEGDVDVQGVRAAYPAPAMQRLLARVDGGTHYSATVSVRDKHPEIVVDSTLRGVRLDFPAPLKKAAAETMPMRFRLTGMPSDDVLTARDELRLTLGDHIEARYRRRKSLNQGGGNDGKGGNDGNDAWQVVAGGIGVSAPAPMPDSGVAANLDVAALNVDDWRNAISVIVGSDDAAPPETDDDAPADAASASAPASESGLQQYVDLQQIAARATELTVLGKKLDNVVLGASHSGRVWQANVDAAQTSGYVTWRESASGKGLGRVTARLASLIIPESAAGDVGDLIEGNSEAARIPALDITADDFQLFGKRFGRLELDAANRRGSKGRTWQIKRLSLSNPDATLKAAGEWNAGAGGGPGQSSLTYALDVADAGRLLQRLGFADVLRKGHGRLDGDLHWNGLPYSLDIPSLSGALHLTMQKAQFLKVEPGAAKLLGVLNLQSLPRRLALDFRDVFSEGFAFDTAVGTATIAQGRLTTDNFKMRSPAATVLIDGSADIAHETESLHVAVIPQFNAGAASVLAGLAINPVVGVGSLLAQLFLRDPLSRAFTFEYRITGPWTDPVVTKLDRHTGKPAVPAAGPDPDKAG